MAWGALALVFLLVNVHRLSTAVLSEQLTADFAISAAQLGTLHAAFFVIYAIVQIPTGVLADRFGPRYIGAGGAVVLSVGAIGFTLSDGYLVAFLSRALTGLGSGVIFISILRFSANWFRVDEFGMMTGLTAGVAGLGAIISTTPLALAVGAFGWRPTVASLAILGFVAGAAVFVLARRSPADAGLDPIENVPEQPSITLDETLGYIRALLADPDQWLLSVVFFAGMGTVLTIIGLWGVPYLVVVYDLDVTTASYFTLLGSIGMLVGSPTVGWLSDRIGRRVRPMMGGLALFALTLAVVPLTGKPPLPVIAITYFLTGISLGFVMLALPIVKETYPAAVSGVATATVNAAGFFGATVLPPVMGVALDRYRTGDVVGGTVIYSEVGYRIAFGITTLAVTVAFLSSVWLFLRERRGSSDE